MVSHRVARITLFLLEAPIDGRIILSQKGIAVQSNKIEISGRNFML